MANDVFIDREYSGSIITQNEGFLVLLGFDEGNLCLNEKLETQTFGEEAISEALEILNEKEDFLKENICQDSNCNLLVCIDKIIEEEHINPFLDYVFGEEDSEDEDSGEDFDYDDEDEDIGDMSDYDYDFDFDEDEDDEDDCDYESDDEEENFFEDEDDEDEDFDGTIESYFMDPNHWPEDE